MRYYYLFSLIFLLLLNCPAKYVKRVSRIETIYLSSLYEDIHREKPLLAGIRDIPGIKIGYLKTEPSSIALLLEQLGFYELLNETGIDFIIGDTPMVVLNDVDYFLIPRSMGYAITNYNNLRFAILSQDRDSLTISDRIQLSLVQQRSDIFWIIDNQVFESPPKKINFVVKDRMLSDTTTTAIQTKTDTALLQRLIHFRIMVDEALSKNIYLENKKLDDYILSAVAQRAGVEVIVYPRKLFHNVIERDSMSLEEILTNVACEFKFKIIEMDKKDIVTLSKDQNYQIWGTVAEANRVLLPGDDGNYLYNLWYDIR
ncbi:MAG: hypothetical protein JSV97_06340 [candidate division WOR-3 bacterium]|nr:MAG: hypothetical protein JSV97_06340 [candidate division WOR-3 bacterium]